MEKLKIKVKLLHPDAKIPLHATADAAGFDLYSVEEVILGPGETKIVPTGISMEIPKGHCVQFRDRSGLGAKGIHHFAGLIDSDYRGEFKVVLHNSGKESYKIAKGDRIIQGVLTPVFQADFEKSAELSETARGAGGFHSTGKQ